MLSNLSAPSVWGRADKSGLIVYLKFARKRSPFSSSILKDWSYIVDHVPVRCSWAQLTPSLHRMASTWNLSISLTFHTSSWAKLNLWSFDKICSLFGNLCVHTSSTSNKFTLSSYLLTWKFHTPYSCPRRQCTGWSALTVLKEVLSCTGKSLPKIIKERTNR